jgi:non-ribosomal peptide synthetase component F
MQEDIVVGSPVAARTHPDLKNIIGMFVNMLALRNYPCSNKTYREFLGEVKENVLKAFENQDYPFDSLVAKLNLESDVSRHPLVDTAFVLENFDVYSQRNSEPELELKPYEVKITKFDLELSGIEVGKRIWYTFDYRTNLFKKETIERMRRHFLKIIEEVVNHPDIKISDINLVSEGEVEDLKKGIRDSNLANNPSKIKESNQNRLSKAAAADFDF